MKKTSLKKSVWKTASIILSGFIAVCGIIVGIMYLSGSFDPVVIKPTSIKFEQELYEPDIYWSCSEKTSVELGDANLVVQYSDDNSFGVIRKDAGETTGINEYSDAEMTNTTINAYNNLSVLYANFIGNFNITDDEKTWRPGNGSNAYNTFSQFFNASKEMYNSSNLSITKNIADSLVNSAVIGINKPFTILFDTSDNPNLPTLEQFKNVVSRLFGYNDVELFVEYAQKLADAYATNEAEASSTTNSDRLKYDGAIYTNNGSFILPFAFKAEGYSTLLTFVVVDANGVVSVWFNDVTSALKIANVGNGMHNPKVSNSTITVDVLGRSALFETLRHDKVGVLVDSFYIKVTAEPEGVTVDDIELSVDDSFVVSLDSPKAKIGELIKVNINKDLLNGNVPYGGATKITARAYGGVYGMDTCNVFIDVPVTKVNIKTDLTTDVLHLNQTMNISEPEFLPGNSRNPSQVAEGTQLIQKPNKEYIYKLYFELVQPGGTTWIDVENPTYIDNDAIKTAKWLDEGKTQIKALKTGRFMIKVFAFDTYSEQQRLITQETEDEKLERMRCTSEKIYTVSEIDIASLDANNYTGATDSVELIYKQSKKIYLRTNKTATQLAQENAVNLDVFINPDSATNLTYKNMYAQLKDVYLTTNINNQATILEINGNKVEFGDGERLYPIMDDIWEYAADKDKEFYFEITVIGKADPFKLSLSIDSPNRQHVFTKDFSFKIGEISTDIFTFNRGTATSDGVQVVIDPNDINRNTISMTIDPDEPKEINLNNYITNATSNGVEPTYNLIKFYAMCSTSLTDFETGLYDLNEKLDLGDSAESYQLDRDVYGVLIPDGILKPLSDVDVMIYGVLVQTDYLGNEVKYALTDSFSYRTTKINLIVETVLKEVSAEFLDINGERLDDGELKENNEYLLAIKPTYNGYLMDISVLQREISHINVKFEDTEENKPAQITITDNTFYLVENSSQAYYYIKVAIPSSSLNDFGKTLTARVFYDEELAPVGSSTMYTIKNTSVTSMSLNIQSVDQTPKRDFVYEAFIVGNEVVWKEVYLINGVKQQGDELDYDIIWNQGAENQNYALRSSDSSIIKIETTPNGKQMPVCVRPSGDNWITITAISNENSEITSSVRIKTFAESFTFEPTNDTIEKGVTVYNGELYKDGQVYNIDAYNGNIINIFDIVTMMQKGLSYNGLADISIPIPTNSVVYANQVGENGLTRDGDIKFVQNVIQDETITVALTSVFGDKISVTFNLKNSLNIALKLDTAYNQSVNSDGESSVQNQAVISEWNNRDYITFVYKFGNTINFKDYSSCTYVEGATQSDIGYTITDGYKFININNDGNLTYNSSFGEQLTQPTKATIKVAEKISDGQGGFIDGYYQEFDIVIVPDIRTKYNDVDHDGNVETLDRRTFLAGQYYGTNDDFVKTIQMDSSNKVIELNGNEKENALFKVMDFAGNKKTGVGVTFEVVQDIEVCVYNATTKTLEINSNKVYTKRNVLVKMNYYYNTNYVFEENIEIMPYYEVRTITDDNPDEIYIHVGETQYLSDLISISNDGNNALKNALNYALIGNPTYANTSELGSSTARITGRIYSGADYNQYRVKVGNDNTGLIIKAFVKHNLDIDTYSVEDDYNNVESPFVVNSNTTLGLYDVFTAQTYNEHSNITLMLQCQKYKYNDEVATWETSDYAWLLDGNIHFAQVATNNIKIRVQASTGLADVEPLYAYFSLTAGQELHLSYPVEQNELNKLNYNKTQMVTAFKELDYVEIDENYYNSLKYIEIKAGDEVIMNDYIQAVNKVDGDEEDITDLLNYAFYEFNIDSGKWVVSNKVSMVTTNDALKLVATSSLTIPTIIWMVITTDGELFGIYSIYLLDTDSVNNDTNINFVITYPNNSSNILEIGKTFEYVDIDVDEEKTINLLGYDSESGVQRVSAIKRNKPYTNIYLYATYDDDVFDVSFTEGNIKIKRKKVGTVENLKITVGFYTSYYNSKNAITEKYNIYISDGYVVSLLEPTLTNGANTTLQYAEGTPAYSISDYLNVLKIDGSEVENLSYKYYTLYPDNAEWIEESYVVVLSNNDALFQLTNMLDTEGTLFKIVACDNDNIINDAEYIFRLLPSERKFLNNDKNSLNSQTNPLIMYYGDETSSIREITLVDDTSFDTEQFGDFQSVEITPYPDIVAVNKSGDDYDYKLSLKRDVNVETMVKLKIKLFYDVDNNNEADVVKTEIYYIKVMPNYSFRIVSKELNNTEDSIYGLQTYNPLDKNNNVYFELLKYNGTEYQEVPYDRSAFRIYVEDNYNESCNDDDLLGFNSTYISQEAVNVDIRYIKLFKGNGVYDEGESYTDTNENGQYDDAETYTDANENGQYDDAETYTDANGNGQYDVAESFEDECIFVYYKLYIYKNTNSNSLISAPSYTSEQPTEWKNDINLEDMFILSLINNENISSDYKADKIDINKIIDSGGFSFYASDVNITISRDSVTEKYKVNADKVTTIEDVVHSVSIYVGNREDGNYRDLGSAYIKILKNYSFEPTTEFDTMYKSGSIDLNYLGNCFEDELGNAINGGTLSFIALSDDVNITNNEFTINDDVFINIGGNVYEIIVTYTTVDDLKYVATTKITVLPDLEIIQKEFGYVSLSNEINGLIAGPSAQLVSESSNLNIFIKSKKYSIDLNNYIDVKKTGFPANIADLDASDLVFDVKQVGSLENIYSLKISSAKANTTANIMLMLESSNTQSYLYSAVSEERRRVVSGETFELNSVNGEFKGKNNTYDAGEVYTDLNNNGRYDLDEDFVDTYNVIVQPMLIEYVGVYGDAVDFAGAYIDTNSNRLVTSYCFVESTAYVIVKMTGINSNIYYGVMPVVVTISMQFKANVSDSINNIMTAYIGDVFNVEDLVAIDQRNPQFDLETLDIIMSLSSIYDINGTKITDQRKNPTIRNNTISFEQCSVGDLILVNLNITKDGVYTDTNRNGQYDYAEDYTDANNNKQYDDGEEYVDRNGNGQYDVAEVYTDANGNNQYDDGESYTDTNGNSQYDVAEVYTDTNGNKRYDMAESYTDTNGNGQYDVAEPYIDTGNGQYDVGEPYIDTNENGNYDIGEPYTDMGNGQYDVAEVYTDANSNGQYDVAETYTDANSNGQYDVGEEYIDANGNGQYDYAEEFVDANSNRKYDIAEPYTDTNGNGQYDYAEEYIDANSNGRYDVAETYTDANSNGRYDVAEPYIDANGNGKIDNIIKSLILPIKLIGYKGIFTHNAELKTFKQGDVLQLSDFGTISGCDDSTNIIFYTINNKGNASSDSSNNPSASNQGGGSTDNEITGVYTITKDEDEYKIDDVYLLQAHEVAVLMNVDNKYMAVGRMILTPNSTISAKAPLKNINKSDSGNCEYAIIGNINISENIKNHPDLNIAYNVKVNNVVKINAVTDGEISIPWGELKKGDTIHVDVAYSLNNTNFIVGFDINITENSAVAEIDIDLEKKGQETINSLTLNKTNNSVDINICKNDEEIEDLSDGDLYVLLSENNVDLQINSDNNYFNIEKATNKFTLSINPSAYITSNINTHIYITAVSETEGVKKVKEIGVTINDFTYFKQEDSISETQNRYIASILEASKINYGSTNLVNGLRFVGEYVLNTTNFNNNQIGTPLTYGNYIKTNETKTETEFLFNPNNDNEYYYVIRYEISSGNYFDYCFKVLSRSDYTFSANIGTNILKYENGAFNYNSNVRIDNLEVKDLKIIGDRVQQNLIITSGSIINKEQKQVDVKYDLYIKAKFENETRIFAIPLQVTVKGTGNESFTISEMIKKSTVVNYYDVTGLNAGDTIEVYTSKGEKLDDNEFATDKYGKLHHLYVINGNYYYVEQLDGEFVTVVSYGENNTCRLSCYFFTNNNKRINLSIDNEYLNYTNFSYDGDEEVLSLKNASGDKSGFVKFSVKIENKTIVKFVYVEFIDFFITENIQLTPNIDNAQYVLDLSGFDELWTSDISEYNGNAPQNDYISSNNNVYQFKKPTPTLQYNASTKEVSVINNDYSAKVILTLDLGNNVYIEKTYNITYNSGYPDVENLNTEQVIDSIKVLEKTVNTFTIDDMKNNIFAGNWPIDNNYELIPFGPQYYTVENDSLQFINNNIKEAYVILKRTTLGESLDCYYLFKLSYKPTSMIEQREKYLYKIFHKDELFNSADSVSLKSILNSCNLGSDFNRVEVFGCTLSGTNIDDYMVSIVRENSDSIANISVLVKKTTGNITTNTYNVISVKIPANSGSRKDIINKTINESQLINIWSFNTTLTDANKTTLNNITEITDCEIIEFVKNSDFNYNVVYKQDNTNLFVVNLNYNIEYVYYENGINYESATTFVIPSVISESLGEWDDYNGLQYTATINNEVVTLDSNNGFSIYNSIYGKTFNLSIVVYLKGDVIYNGKFIIKMASCFDNIDSNLTDITKSISDITGIEPFDVKKITYTDKWGEIYEKYTVSDGEEFHGVWEAYKVLNNELTSGAFNSFSSLISFYELTLSDNDFTKTTKAISSASIVGVKGLDGSNISDANLSNITINAGSITIPNLVKPLTIKIKFTLSDNNEYSVDFLVKPIALPELQFINAEMKKDGSIYKINTQNNFDINMSQVVGAGLIFSCESSVNPIGKSTNPITQTINSNSISVSMNSVDIVVYELEVTVTDIFEQSANYLIVIRTGSPERAYQYEQNPNIIEIDAGESYRIKTQDIGEYYLPEQTIGGVIYDRINLVTDTNWEIITGSELIDVNNYTVTAHEVLSDTYVQVGIKVTYDTFICLGYVKFLIKSKYSFEVIETMKYIEANTRIDTKMVVKILNNDVDITNNLVFNPGQNEGLTTGITSVVTSVKVIDADDESSIALKDDDIDYIETQGSDIIFGSETAGKKYIVIFKYNFHDGTSYSNYITVLVGQPIISFVQSENPIVLHSGESVKLSRNLVTFLDENGYIISGGEVTYELSETSYFTLINDVLTAGKVLNDVSAKLKVILAYDEKDYIAELQVVCLSTFDIKDIKYNLGGDEYINVEGFRLPMLLENKNFDISFEIYNTYLNSLASGFNHYLIEQYFDANNNGQYDAAETFVDINQNGVYDNNVINNFDFTAPYKFAGSEVSFTIKVVANDTGDSKQFTITIPIKERKLIKSVLIKDYEFNYVLNDMGMSITEIAKLESGLNLKVEDAQIECNLDYEIIDDGETQFIRIINIDGNMQAVITITDKINGSSVTYRCTVIKKN